MDKVELVTVAKEALGNITVPCHVALGCLFQDLEDSKGDVLIIFAEIFGYDPGRPGDPVGSSQMAWRPSKKEVKFCTDSLQYLCKVVSLQEPLRCHGGLKDGLLGPTGSQH